MKTTPKVISKLFPLLLCAASAQVLATTIQFESTVPSGGFSYFSSPYSEGGYTLTSSNSDLSGFFSPSFGSYGDFSPSASSNFLGLCACTEQGAVAKITIARTDSSPFSLNSLDAGFGHWIGSATSLTLHIYGIKTDSSIFESTFTINNNNQWHTISLASDPNFFNLKQVEISATGISSNLALDNINISEVPIPTSVWLFGSSLAGIFGITRKISIKFDAI